MFTAWWSLVRETYSFGKAFVPVSVCNLLSSNGVSTLFEQLTPPSVICLSELMWLKAWLVKAPVFIPGTLAYHSALYVIWSRCTECHWVAPRSPSSAGCLSFIMLCLCLTFFSSFFLRRAHPRRWPQNPEYSWRSAVISHWRGRRPGPGIAEALPMNWWGVVVIESGVVAMSAIGLTSDTSQPSPAALKHIQTTGSNV